MKRLHTRGGRFDSEDVNPMNYISNLSDAMLILAVGIMLALIVHWNVDISTSGGTMSDSGTTYAADGSVLVFNVTKVTPGNPDDASGEERSMVQQQLAALAGREDADTLLRTLRQQMKVTVVESRL